MAATIRRMTAADATEVHTFLGKVFAADPGMVGSTAPTASKLAAQVQKGTLSWVAVENGKIVGVVGPLMPVERVTDAGEKRTAHYFNRMAVDYAKTPAQATLIARDLTLAILNDNRTAGTLPDDAMVEGASICRGADWCRRLGCEEVVLSGGRSRFFIPIAVVEARCKAIK